MPEICTNSSECLPSPSPSPSPSFSLPLSPSSPLSFTPSPLSPSLPPLPSPVVLIPASVLVPVVFTLIFLLGTVGNGLVLAVLLRNGPQVKYNTTNLFILSLCAADLCFILCCVPFQGTIYSLDGWLFGAFMCKAVHFFIYLTMHASSFTLAAVSVDRYLAIRHPLKSRDLRTSRNAAVAIALIWTLSLLFSAPYLSYFHTVRFRGGGASPDSSPSAGGGVSVVCVPVWTDRSRKIMDLITFSFGYLLPVCTLGLAYARTLLFLWGPGDPLDRPPGAQPGRGARGRVTRMIVAVAVLFCVCWLPHHLLILWFWFGRHFPFNRVTYALRLASHCLSYANSCLNPLVYALASKHFRKGFKQVFTCLLLQQRSGRQRPPASRQHAAPTALRGLMDPPSLPPPPPPSSAGLYKLLPFRRHGNRVAPLPGSDTPPAAKPIEARDVSHASSEGEIGGAGPSRRGEEPGTGGGAERDRRGKGVPGKRCDWTAGQRREGPGKAWEV